MKRLGMITKRLLVTLLILAGIATVYKLSGAATAPQTLLQQAQVYEQSGDLLQAIAIYGRIVTEHTDKDQESAAHGRLIRLYLGASDGSQVRAAIQAIMDDIMATLPPRRQRVEPVQPPNPFEEEITQYKSALAQTTDVDEALEARGALTLTYIAAGKGADADRSVTILQEDYAGHQDLPKVLFDIAGCYDKAGKYGRAQRLCQAIASDYPGTKWALKSRSKLLVYDIPHEETQAEATWQAIEQLVVDFTGDPSLPEALYHIAQKYERTGLYQDAQAAYQVAVEQNTDPNDAAAGRAQLAVSKCRILASIDRGDDQEAFALLGQTVQDFWEHEYIPAVVYKVGERYYRTAFRLEKEGLAEQATDCIGKALAVYRTVTDSFANSDAYVMAYYGAADCYRRLGQYQDAATCYEKVFADCSNKQPGDVPGYSMAWNSLAQIARNWQLLGANGYVSVADADRQTQAAYQRLVGDYPDCAAVKLAKGWLDNQARKETAR